KEASHRKLSSTANSNERSFTTMAQGHYRTPFTKALLQFITEPDPFLAMLKWVMTEMMRIEAEAKVGGHDLELSKMSLNRWRFQLGL
ncbi:MAG: hypothetical protein MUO96_04815, partial [Actinobacteria bacterium]|nr:hypothetical protein [Actinomycetota bacterium]